MKGATAEPWLKTISIPNKARTIIIGNKPKTHNGVSRKCVSSIL